MSYADARALLQNLIDEINTTYTNEVAEAEVRRQSKFDELRQTLQMLDTRAGSSEPVGQAMPKPEVKKPSPANPSQGNFSPTILDLFKSRGTLTKQQIEKIITEEYPTLAMNLKRRTITMVIWNLKNNKKLIEQVSGTGGGKRNNPAKYRLIKTGPGNLDFLN